MKTDIDKKIITKTTLSIQEIDRKEKADELVIAKEEKAKREAELVIADKEKSERADELIIANNEKTKRSDELIIANIEKAKRSADLVIANVLKAKLAAELVIANVEKSKRADELIIADKEITYQNEERLKRAAELVVANVKVTKRAAELVIANVNKAKRSAELIIANKELAFQNSEKAKRLEELIIANIEKDKRAEELVIANEEKEKRAAELITTNKKLVFQNKEIIDSINYARLIQNAIFPSKKQLEEAFPKSFVLARPKHIVSGDFHWIEKHKNKVFIAVSDCTGHGVPGAFISIIGYKLLRKFIIEYGFSSPAEILNQLNNEFFVSDKQIIESVFEIKDGLDIALCVVDKSKMTMMYAGAYNPIYQIRNGKFTKLSVDRIPIHLFTKHTGETFTNHEIEIEKDDIYYMFSDGYASKFGGTKGGEFMRKNLQELILSIQQLKMSEQREIFNNSIEEWKNTFGEEQTDDILILGFKIS